jgi:hypothetical protein
MARKKKGAPAQAAAAPVAVSVLPLPAAPVVEIQKGSKGQLSSHIWNSDLISILVPYVPQVYPYTPSRKERREYVHAKLKGEPIWVKEPTWVKTRKANHERSRSQNTSTIFSASSRGNILSPPDHRLSPTVRPFTPRAHIKPPPTLQPLLLTNPQASRLDSTDNSASHTVWWAHISNSLASLSARSYHLFVASNFLNCKSEELLLLYEVRKLNADGKQIFEEVVKGLRARQLNWDFLGGCEGIDELRISWDMMAKGEMVGRYDAFVGEQVGRLER